jgi:hypothetical protein
MTIHRLGKDANLLSAVSVGRRHATKSNRELVIRVSCWCVALALGAADAWASRFSMYPDGVSYLDVGDAFWRGDWHHAINGYWSPVYPWLLGSFVKAFHPSANWEYPLVHLVNLFMYAIAMVCFDYFLWTFVAQQQQPNEHLAIHSEIGLPKWAWLVAGYSTFLSSSLLMITISFVSGDMLIAAAVYLAAALILKIRMDHANQRTLLILGLVLGVGYLIKAVMFLMAIPFLAIAIAAHKKTSRGLKPAWFSLLAFLLTVGPFVLVLSWQKGRPTFGDSGKINYEISVNEDWFFIPRSAQTQHPVRQISDSPTAFAYPYSVAVTYPLWFDPSYWHAGIRPALSMKQQMHATLNAVIRCCWISFSPFFGLNITVAIFFLYLLAPSVSHCLRIAAQNWPLWIPAVSGIGLYSLVVIEPRYVAALFCLLWLVGFSGVRLPAALDSRGLIAGAVVSVAITTLLITGWQISQECSGSIFVDNHVATPVSVEVAQALKERGFIPGDKLAVIGEHLFPSQEAAYVSRLARIQIVAEMTRPKEFWAADASIRSRLSAAFASTGARAILTINPPQAESGWERLGNTNYYLFRL